MWGRSKKPKVGAALTAREWLVVLKVLHVLARLGLIEQVYTAAGRIRWRKVSSEKSGPAPAETSPSPGPETPTPGSTDPGQ